MKWLEAFHQESNQKQGHRREQTRPNDEGQHIGWVIFFMKMILKPLKHMAQKMTNAAPIVDTLPSVTASMEMSPANATLIPAIWDLEILSPKMKVAKMIVKKALNCRIKDAIPAERPRYIPKLTMPHKPTPNRSPYSAMMDNRTSGFLTKKISGRKQNVNRSDVSKKGSKAPNPSFITEKLAPHIPVTNMPSSRSTFFMDYWFHE